MSAASAKIGFVGAGSMAQAIAEGLITSGTVPKENVMASATSDRFKSWWTERNVEFIIDNHKVITESSVVFVAMKPHLFEGFLQDLASRGVKYTDSKLYISIMAGVTLKDLEAGICVRKGNVAVTFGDKCTSQDKLLVHQLFSSVGKCIELPDSLQNAFAAMAGAGPAYIYQVVEALADGGVMMGLPRAVAMEHAAAMVEGAGAMVLHSGKHPGQLKDEVCSPGGSTIRGVQKLEEGGVRAAFMAAVQAATERNFELGKK